MCNSFNFLHVPNAFDISIAPSHSALFLAIANISKLCSPSYNPSDIYVTPLIPKPQLFKNNLYN